MPFVARIAESYTSSSDLVNSGLNGLHQLLQSAGWTVLEELSAVPGAEDRVYHSDGEAGDEALFLRMTHNAAASRIFFRAYGFWDPTTSIGYLPIGDGSGNTALRVSAGAMTGWLSMTKDSLGIVVKVGWTAYYKFAAVRLERVTPQALSSRTTLAAPVGGANETGASKLYVVAGTDFSRFQPGQKLWVLNQDLNSGIHAEVVEIQSVDGPGRLLYLVTPLVNTYDFGGLVEQNPQPLVLWGDQNGSWEGATPYGLHDGVAYVQQTLSKASNVQAFPQLTQDEFTSLHCAPITFHAGLSPDLFILGDTSTRVLEVPASVVSDEDTLSFEGTDHVIFKETTQAFSLRVS